MTSLDSIFNEMEEKTKYDSEFMTLKVGKNPIRILSDFVKVETIYKGEYKPGIKGSSKYMGHMTPGRVLDTDEKVTIQGWAWVLDRSTNEVKIGQFGKNILGQIVSLRNDPEYAFTSFPMPYDININNTGEGANRYSIVASRTNKELTVEEMAQLNKKKSIADIVKTIIEKQVAPVVAGTAPAYPENNLSTSAEW